MNPTGLRSVRPLADLEREAIEHAVAVLGTVPAAARALGIGAATLYRRLRAYREASRD